MIQHFVFTVAVTVLQIRFCNLTCEITTLGLREFDDTYFTLFALSNFGFDKMEILREIQEQTAEFLNIPRPL